MFPLNKWRINLLIILVAFLCTTTGGQVSERAIEEKIRDVASILLRNSINLHRRQHEKHEPMTPIAVTNPQDLKHDIDAASKEGKKHHENHAAHKHGGGKHEARPKHTSEETEGFEENHFFSDFAPHGSIFFYMLTTITATLNICASSAVIYISYIDYQEIKYRNQEASRKPHLSSSIRFPFYIAILDLFLGCVTLFMVADTMYWDELPSSKTCAVIGGILYLGTFIEMTVVGTVAVVTYLQLVRKIDVYLGRWDWKVWVGCGFSCLGTAIAGVHTQGFGPDLYWCLVNEHTYSGQIFLKLFLSVHYVVLFIVLVCYLLVLHDMVFKANSEEHSKEQHGRVKRTLSIHSNHRYSATLISAVQKHRKHTENLGIALFLHVFHFTPAIVHMILQLKGYHRAWVYVVAAAFIQLGGVLNGIEVFIHRKPIHPKWKQRVEDRNFQDDSKLTVNQTFDQHDSFEANYS
ncbi:hypothetical protein K7432_015608 [Basidiobolus ranarum]|uniref:G-protein coupled receptors family 1 profile domain-containing protein n=1 Tax=Basidiobolus ranarum TaxID=34480 RepID=A0ABR2WFV8_9FUNG